MSNENTESVEIASDDVTIFAIELFFHYERVSVSKVHLYYVLFSCPFVGRVWRTLKILFNTLIGTRATVIN